MFGQGLSMSSGLLCSGGGLGPPPSYVRVLFDYGYVDQSKKHVLMRENEVLLLLKKTNVDWWQVIRRGERRPFYAPAKYVHEMRGDPPPAVLDSRYIKPVTTFGGFPCKRSSYAHPTSTTAAQQVRHPLEPRLSPRYRSNSLDSILVSDQTKALLTLRDIPTGGGIHPNYSNMKGQAFLMAPPVASLGGGSASAASRHYLEKRPTIEALDKRKSWNIMESNNASRSQGRLSTAYGMPVLARQASKAANKKPVPLPRIKTGKNASESPSKGLGKRSKTDLTLEGLSAYKANRSGEKANNKGAPLLSTFGRGKAVVDVEDVPPPSGLSRVLSESNLSAGVNSAAKSEPLVIMTQPLKDASPGRIASSLDSSEGEPLTKSSSFDSCFEEEASLDDSTMLSLLNVYDEDTGKSRLLMDDTASSLSPEMKSPVSTTSRSPPSPSPHMTPTRNLMVEWDEYCDEKSGRKFYYNSLTKEKSWKPPRKTKGWSEGYSAPTSPDPESDKVKRKLDLSEAHVSSPSDEVEEEARIDECHEVTSSTPNPLDEVADVEEDLIPKEEKKKDPPEEPINDELSIPDGYEEHNDGGECVYYVNIFTGVRWYSARDESGKAYFYEENGNESCWSLPNVAHSIQDRINSSSSSSEEAPSPEVPRTAVHAPARPGCFLSSPNFQIGSVNIVVLKQGPLNKTKIFENGKKTRKNWCGSHVVLTDTFLLFFKDAKTFASMQSGGAKPEHVVDLKGTLIEWCKGDKSKRSYVFEVTSALFGLSVLLQGESLNVSAEWFKEINDVIEGINGGGSFKRDSLSSATSAKVSRTKSIKMKLFLGSSEELESPPPTPPAHELPKSNIREKLKKFFLRRPTMEDLFKRGIIKNEPVFGSTLRELMAVDGVEVPLFVKRCVREIEKGDFLSTDGVYRQSGNLSTIQKIRLQVDQGNLGILESVDDVHVLTGSLKLFFRELKEPLIPWEAVDDLLQVPTQSSRKARVKALRDVLSKMPSPHRSTLLVLLKHLTRVTEFKEANRMQVHNLAIVFGPTLMWPPPHLGASSNLALDMMQQNIIVETLLSHVNSLL